MKEDESAMDDGEAGGGESAVSGVKMLRLKKREISQ